MRACPSCGQPLVREVRDGREVERCTRRGCDYRVWVVPLERQTGDGVPRIDDYRRRIGR